MSLKSAIIILSQGLEGLKDKTKKTIKEISPPNTLMPTKRLPNIFLNAIVIFELGYFLNC